MGTQAFLFEQDHAECDGKRSHLEIQNDVHGEQSGKAMREEVTGANLNRLRLRQGNRCYYTGAELTLANVSIDHKQPLSKGGKHTVGNIALCLSEVNKMKRQMTEQEFIAICQLVAAQAEKGGVLPGE